MSGDMNEHNDQLWRQQLADVIRSPAELFDMLDLPANQLTSSEQAEQLFALRVPRPYAARIRKGDLNDPLLQQVLPQGKELLAIPGYSNDPLAEKDSNPVPGLIHKYAGRVLLVASGGCAINCRYCFRRHFPYSDNNPGRNGWQSALDYIANDNSIHEVILSGGDPLVNTDDALTSLITAIAAIEHVTTLRIHSRLPIVIPARLNRSLLSLLQQCRLQVVLVVHCNHPNEIDSDVSQALRRAANHQITVLNQSVLLAGINDNAETLSRLSHALFATGTLPYYPHVLDKVAGAAHFDLPDHKALALIKQLRAMLPGYLVPKLVREIPEKPSKTPLES
jgi:EF-P beta-lysylation protein EpmB